jgi:hypothetical protein
VDVTPVFPDPSRIARELRDNNHLKQEVNMKFIHLLGMIACLSLLACETTAQGPVISTRHANEEIKQMILAYKAAGGRDTRPTGTLHQRFRADFPDARDVEWETARDIYEVEFEIRYRDYKAYYDSRGDLLMLVKEIKRGELPAVVRNAAESRYPKYTFEDIDHVRRGTELFYIIEMERGDLDVKLIISPDGTLLDETFEY